MSFSRKQFLKASALSPLAFTGLAKTTEFNKNESVHQLIKPKALNWNSTIGLVAPASPVYNPDDFDEMLKTLSSFGFNLVLGQHVKDRNGYLAGTDEDRASDLMAMFKNDSIDGILCVRGGWGCNRILDLLDYEVIKKNPKPLIGFSDITSLHNSILAKSGLVSFHGPVGTSDWNSFTKESFQIILMDKKEGVYNLPEDESDAFVINSGSVQGKIVGGNLTVLVGMIGSDYLPSFNDSILFLEDVGESVYRIDRMITQLKLAGVLDQISGFIYGKCTRCDAGANSLTLKQVFDDHIKPLNIPAFYGGMISHEEKNVTIPVGLRAEMNADNFSFKILEKAVL